MAGLQGWLVAVCYLVVCHSILAEEIPSVPGVLAVTNNLCDTTVSNGGVLHDIESAMLPTENTKELSGLYQTWEQRFIFRGQGEVPSWQDSISKAVNVSGADLMKVGVFKRLLLQLAPILRHVVQYHAQTQDQFLTPISSSQDNIDLDVAGEFEKLGLYGMLFYPNQALLQLNNIRGVSQDRDVNFDGYLEKIFTLFANKIVSSSHVSVIFEGEDVTLLDAAGNAILPQFPINSPIGLFRREILSQFEAVPTRAGFNIPFCISTLECMICQGPMFYEIYEQSIKSWVDGFHDAMVAMSRQLQYLALIDVTNTMQETTAAPSGDASIKPDDGGLSPGTGDGTATGTGDGTATGTGDGTATVTGDGTATGTGDDTTTGIGGDPDGTSPGTAVYMDILPLPKSLSNLLQHMMCSSLKFNERNNPDLSPVTPEELKHDLASLIETQGWSGRIQEHQGQPKEVLAMATEGSAKPLLKLEAFDLCMNQTIRTLRIAVDLRAKVYKALDMEVYMYSIQAYNMDEQVMANFKNAALIALVLYSGESTSVFGVIDNHLDTFTKEAFRTVKDHFLTSTNVQTSTTTTRDSDVSGFFNEFFKMVDESMNAVLGLISELQIPIQINPFYVPDGCTSDASGLLSCGICNNPEYLEIDATDPIDVIVMNYHNSLNEKLTAFQERVSMFIETMTYEDTHTTDGEGVDTDDPTHTVDDGTGIDTDGTPTDEDGTMEPEEIHIRDPVKLLDTFTDASSGCRDINLTSPTWELDLMAVIPGELKLELENLTTHLNWADKVLQAIKETQSPQGLLSGIAQQSTRELVFLEAYSTILDQTFQSLKFAAEQKLEIAGVDDPMLGVMSPSSTNNKRSMETMLLASFRQAVLSAVLLYHQEGGGGLTSRWSTNTEEPKPFDLFTERALSRLESVYKMTLGFTHSLEDSMISQVFKDYQDGVHVALTDVMSRLKLEQVYSFKGPFNVLECEITTMSADSADAQTSYLCSMCVNPDIWSGMENAFNAIDVLVLEYHHKLKQLAVGLEETIEAYGDHIEGATGSPSPRDEHPYEAINHNQCIGLTGSPRWYIEVPGEDMLSNQVFQMVENFTASYSERSLELQRLLGREGAFKKLLDTSLYFQSADVFNLMLAGRVGEETMRALKTMGAMLKIAQEAGNKTAGMETNPYSGGMYYEEVAETETLHYQQARQHGLLANLSMPGVLFFPSAKTQRYLNTTYSFTLPPSNTALLRLLSPFQSDYFQPTMTDKYIYTIIETEISELIEKSKMEHREADDTVKELLSVAFAEVDLSNTLARVFAAVRGVFGEEESMDPVGNYYPMQSSDVGLSPSCLNIECQTDKRKNTHCEVCVNDYGEMKVMAIEETTNSIMESLREMLKERVDKVRMFLNPVDAVEPTDGDVKDPDNGGTEGGDVVDATEKGEDDSVTESPADTTERDGNVKVTEKPVDVTDKGGNSMVTETPADFTEISDKVTESSADSTERGNKVTEKPAEVTEKVGNSRVTETPAVVTEMSDKATESSADSTEKSDNVSVTEKPAIVTEEGDNSMVTEPAGVTENSDHVSVTEKPADGTEEGDKSMVTEPAGVTENSDSVRVTVSPAGVTENDDSGRITKSPAGVTEKGTNVKVTETPVVEEFNLMAAISGPSSIPECGDVKLEGRALGTNLPSMRFQWSIEPSTDALDQTFASINENGIMDVLSFSGNLLNSGVDYIVTLTLQTDMGNRDATIGISKMDSLVPGLTIEARGLSAGNTVLASQTFYLEAKVTFYSCIPSKTTVYEWSVADGNGQTFWAGFQEQSPKQKIEAKRVPVNQEVTFIVKAWREGDANKATSEIKLTVLRSPLVAIIAGGSQRTLGRESRLTLDASGSKDLDAMTYSSGELQYQWECSRPQEDAACYLAGASVTSKTLSVGPGVLSNGMHTFTVTVSKLNAANTNDHREATASVKVDIQSGSPPEAVLTREFNGMFKPQQLIVVTAEIAKKGDTERVLWAITKGAETQDVHSQAETSFEKNDADDTAIATITLPAGTLTAGSDYEIRAMMVDDGDTELSSAATKITIYREISGCRVSLQSEYVTLSPGQIKVDRCVGSDGLTYQAFVASTNTPAKKIPLMTVPVDSSLLNIEFLWEVEGAEYVNIIVRVCAKEGRCKEFTEESIRQVQRITEAAIQAITDDIQKDKESGDYVQAFHKNSRIMKSRAATSGNRRRRATADGIAEHYSLLTDATSLLGSIGAAERSTISLDLETFPDVQTEDQSMTMLTNLKDLIRSYIGDDPEHLRETFEELNEQIAETHAGLALPADRRELRRHAQNLTRHLGTVLQNLQESISRTELVHSRIRRGRLERAIQFDRVNISFPLSVIFERLGGREVLLHIEDYQSEEVADFDYIQSITVLDVSGVPIPLANLLERINVTFPATQMKSICKYLDENTDSWSISGVLTIHEAQNEPVICQTNHLTEFALEVSVDPFNLGDEIVPIAGLTVGAVIGIIIGVLALLVIVIIIVFMVMKMSKNKKVNPQE